MAIAHVQTSTLVTVVSGTSGNVTLTGVGSGNLLVSVLSQTGSGTRTYSGSDDKSNTWAVAVTLNDVGRTAHISYAGNVASGDTQVTMTASSTVTYRFKVVEWSGADTAAPLDQTSSLTDAVAVNDHHCSADSTVIDTAADVVVVAVGTLTASGGTSTAASGYTDLVSGTANAVWQYQISSSALTDERATWNSTNAVTGVNVIASFKGPAGGGGGRTTKNTRSHPLGMYAGRTFRVIRAA